MRRLLPLVALTLVAGACSDDTTSTTAGGETTTTAPSATPTIRPQIILGGLTESDPATLIPVEGAEPIIVGSAHEGVVSDDGSQTAVVTTLRSGYLVSVLDMGSYRIVSTTEVADRPTLLTVDDDGAVYWYAVDEGPQLKLLSPGDDTPYSLAESLPDDFAPLVNQITLLGDDTLGLFGTYTTEDGTSIAAVVIVTAEGVTTTHDLPEVETETESGEQVTPAVVWDRDGDRILVVAATEDVVFELSLNGTLTDHPWDGLGPAVSREAILSPDRTKLFIASTAQQLIVLDSLTWAGGEIIDAPVDALYPSPEGTTLFAVGAATYEIDMGTGQVRRAYQTGVTADSIQFSVDGDFAYLVASTEVGDRVDIVEVAQGELVGTMRFEHLSLIGRAALVAFHQ